MDLLVRLLASGYAFLHPFALFSFFSIFSCPFSTHFFFFRNPPLRRFISRLGKRYQNVKVQALRSDGLNLHILFEANYEALAPISPSFLIPEEPLSVVGVDPGQRAVFTAARGALLFDSPFFCFAHPRQDMRNAVSDLVHLVLLEVTLPRRFPGTGALPLPISPVLCLLNVVRFSQ